MQCNSLGKNLDAINEMCVVPKLDAIFSNSYIGILILRVPLVASFFSIESESAPGRFMPYVLNE